MILKRIKQGVIVFCELAKLPMLKELYLQHNEITNLGAACIATTLLEKCDSLRVLDLSFNLIGKEGLLELIVRSSFKRNLCELYLSYNKVLMTEKEVHDLNNATKVFL